MISSLRKIVLFILLIASLVLFWERVLKTPCDRIVNYDIGSFDERFELTEQQLLTALQLAELPWEEAAGKQLFNYQPGSSFKVNLIFTEQQQRILDGNTLERALDEKENSLDSINNTYSSAVERYERARSSYESSLASYERDVRYWNSKPEASKQEYQSLENRRALLTSQRQEINSLVTLINGLAQKSNQKVNDYNSSAELYSSLFDGKEFDAGDTDGTEINIYSYDNRSELTTLLIHEFGHVLGIDHGDDPRSVMYYLLNDENQKGEFSKEDIEALNLSCRI